MRPSRVLKFYCAVAFLLGIALSVPMVMLMRAGEFTGHDAAILTLCWNTLFLMISPLLVDWSERKYFKARFVQLEELAATNPELKAALDEQCRKLHLPGLRLAAVDTPGTETFTYGLWRQNPRLVVPSSWLNAAETAEKNILPSIEGELNRFASRDLSLVFLAFAVVQFGAQQIALNVLWH
jgi:hypothetical protein